MSAARRQVPSVSHPVIYERCHQHVPNPLRSGFGPQQHPRVLLTANFIDFVARFRRGDSAAATRERGAQSGAQHGAARAGPARTSARRNIFQIEIGRLRWERSHLGPSPPRSPQPPTEKGDAPFRVVSYPITTACFNSSPNDARGAFVRGIDRQGRAHIPIAMSTEAGQARGRTQRQGRRNEREREGPQKKFQACNPVGVLPNESEKSRMNRASMMTRHGP